MSSFKMTGNVVMVGETLEISEKFRKRDLVIETEGEYPQKVSFQFAQDNTKKLDSIAEGSNVEVSFNVRGREWTSPQGEVKYFNTLEGWRIEEMEAVAEAPKASASNASSDDGDDDLPF